MSRARTKDPIQTYKYEVTFQVGSANAGLSSWQTKLANEGEKQASGNIRMGFSKVSGISTERTEVLYSEGSGQEIKVPGRLKIGDITLERGMVAEGQKALATLVSALNLGSSYIPTGQDEFRFNMDIIVKSTLQETPKVVVTYSYMECWIKSYKGPDLDGSADALAIESIVICAEDILIKPGS